MLSAPRARTARRSRATAALRAIAVTAVALIVALALLTVGIPFVTGTQPYTVVTGSMSPAIPTGHIVAVRAVPAAELRVGDVITYQLRSDSPEVATHRIVGVAAAPDGTREFVTRGDANDVADEAPVRAEQIRGRVVFVIPWAGWVTGWLTPQARSAMVVVAGLALLGYGLRTVFRHGRERRRPPSSVPADPDVTTRRGRRQLSSRGVS